jgi:glycosyltransferase involved in cell wall biosynthesis
MAHGFAVPALRARIGELRPDTFDAVVVDHLQMGWALDMLPSEAPVVYVAHNHEAGVRADVARGSGVRRAVLEWDARKVARLERRLTDRAAVVTAITPEDQQLFENDRAGAPVTLLTPGYDGGRVEERSWDGLPRRCIVVGNFTWHVKAANLRDFVLAADPRFAASGAEIRVVGPITSEARRDLEAQVRATTFTGRVDDIAAELAQARLGIVAEQTGGGFKLKTLDYVFHRVPIALLTGSAEGLPLPSNASFEFGGMDALAAGALEALDDAARLEATATAAYDACVDAFDWRDRGQALRAAIARAARPPVT